MGSKGGSSQRPVTQQELALWDSQKVNLDLMTQIASEQFGLSQEDRDYYINTFRDGTDTQAKEALAKLQSQITGQPVDAASIQGVNIDQLLRDTILASTPQFQEAAVKFIQTNQDYAKQYGQDVTGISSAFSQGIKDFTTNYADELQGIKENLGTIDRDILSRETGAATAGLSTAYAESRKGIEDLINRRGLAGSGIEAQILSDSYNQEALAKASAMGLARSSALQQSDALRLQQANLAQAQYGAQMGSAAQQYQANLGGIQNIYGVVTNADMTNYQLQNASQLQQIAGLTQLASAGQGTYLGAQNYISGAAGTAGNAASTAGSSAVGLAGVNSQYAVGMEQAGASAAGGFGNLLGTALTAPIAGPLSGGSVLGNWLKPNSDERLKTNIKFSHVENGYNIYTWDWIDGFDGNYNKGVIAQEVLEINPDAVVVNPNGYYGVDYSAIGLEHLVAGV
jgi:hypothetical protein